MEERISGGEWTEFLPGERRLAEILQVGRDTIRLTLGELEASGWVEVSAQGRRRRIASGKAGRRQSSKMLKIGMLSAHRLERLSQSMLLEVDYIRRAVTGRGGSFEYFAPGWYESKKPAKRLGEFIEAERCTAWLLLRSSSEVQHWFEENRVPCLVRGYPQEGVDLPFLDVNWEATARHAAGMLWRKGHRRVGIVLPPDRFRGVEAAIRGVSELGEEGFEVIPLRENGTVEGLMAMLATAMRLMKPPTAMVATRPRQVPTLLGGAASLGIRVPEDLSVVSLSREPYLDYSVPEVSGYRVDHEAVAKQVVRRIEQLIAGNPNPGASPWIEPDVIKGGSVGAIAHHA
jgi:hypothetical protein